MKSGVGIEVPFQIIWTGENKKMNKNSPEFLAGANCRTTAMGILPHTDPDRALKLALSLDIPFWPQLPRYSFREDMYAQACDGLPGFTVDEKRKTVIFDYDVFLAQLEEFSLYMDDPAYFGFRENSSAVFDKFLQLDLSNYWAIRGQMIGIISFGTKILDKNNKPVIFDENVKEVLKHAFSMKVNWQTAKLLEKNPRAFVWVDDPGLPLIFMGTSGYVENQARADMHDFLEKIKGIKGVHLCGNPEWDFLLYSGLDILSLDAFSCGETVVHYSSLLKFLNRGGIISWGIVPTQTETFSLTDEDKLFNYLDVLWDKLAVRGLNKKNIASQSLLAPATCCLVNPDKEVTVERTFEVLTNLSRRFREKYELYD